MGFTPAQVNEMSVWEFMACCEGFRVSKGGAAAPREVDDETVKRLGIVGFEDG